MEKEKLERYVYKSLRPFTLVLIPSRRRPVVDGAGAISMGAPTRSVKVVFTSGVFEVNKITAATYIKPDGKRFTAKELKKVLEEYPLFGTKYKKTFDSTEKTTEEQIEFSKYSDKKNLERGTKTSHGPRTKAK